MVDVFCLTVEVIVNWEQPQYTTNEGSTISVCVVQMGPTEREFRVILSSPDGPGVLPYSKMIVKLKVTFISSRKFQYRQSPVNFPR